MSKQLQNLELLIESFSGVGVLVVGDIMLDRYYWGQAERISPEAPVPVVKLNKTSSVLGGAANVAANIAGLGAEAFLVGIVGADAEAEILAGILEETKISSKHLLKIKNRQTTIKTRIMAHQQQVVRLDIENASPISLKDAERVLKKIDKLLDKVDIVIISDYAKGLLTEHLLTRLITLAKTKQKKILVDPKGKDFHKYRGVSVLTPNQKEAVEACGFEEISEETLERAGKKLLETISEEAVLMTRGEKGMILFKREGRGRRLNSFARQVFDVTGAGDTVIAGFALALAVGMDFEGAMHLANLAAGAVVEHLGTTAISKKMLRASQQVL